MRACAGPPRWRWKDDVAGLGYTPAVYAILSALIEEHAGLHYGPGDASLLMEKVSVRALERGFDSLLDYYYLLRYDPEGPAELDALVDSLVVNETYFFRELTPMIALVDEYLAPKVASGLRPRVWCAAAATGEEPLTLAMLLAERQLLAHVDLLASDVSERALAQARHGEYGGRSLRQRLSGYERWLEPRGERATVAPELVRAIRWQRINLIAEDELPRRERFDAILCRNVLIYFAPATAARVVERLGQHLVPGGVFMVGVSESLLSFGTSLACEERGGAFFYEKVAP
jgi:chemotaxis protein methyltransferase CheR